MSYGGPTSTQGSGGRLDQPRPQPGSMHPLHTRASALRHWGKRSLQVKAGKKIAFPYFTALMSPTSHTPAVQVEHKGHLWTKQTQAHLTMLTEPRQKLGRPCNRLRCLLACLSLPKKPANAGSPSSPLEHPLLPSPPPYLRSVLSAREMAGFLTALLQAALLLRRENSLRGAFGDILTLSQGAHMPEPTPGTDTAATNPLFTAQSMEEEETRLHLLPGSTAHSEFLYKSGIIPHYISTQNRSHSGGCSNQIRDRQTRNRTATSWKNSCQGAPEPFLKCFPPSTHSISMFSSSTKALNVPTSSKRKMLYLIQACTSASEPHSPNVPATTPSLDPISAGIPRPSHTARAFCRGNENGLNFKQKSGMQRMEVPSYG